MKYVLVNKFDEIVDKVDLDGNVGKTGATTYFQGLKRIPNQKEFNKLWKEDGDYLDIEKSQVNDILSYEKIWYRYCILYSEDHRLMGW